MSCHGEPAASGAVRSSSDAEPDRGGGLVQNCAERALLKQDLFAAGSNCRAWLSSIMHNLFLNKVRRSQIAARHRTDLKSNLKRALPPPQHGAILLTRTLAALATLSGEERDATMRLGAQQLTYREIAASSGISINTVKSRVARGRAHLRRIVIGSAADEAVEL